MVFSSPLVEVLLQLSQGVVPDKFGLRGGSYPNGIRLDLQNLILHDLIVATWDATKICVCSFRGL